MTEKQTLLFGRKHQPPVLATEVPIPEAFYVEGHTLLSGFSSHEDALAYCQNFVRCIDPERLPPFAAGYRDMQLAKIDRIPVCDEIVHTGFQALHYDMGQPFLTDHPQTMYVLSALYRPFDLPPNPEGKTRLVILEKLLKQKPFSKNAEKKLIDYVREHGDGWLEPNKHNTQRLAIFARVLDAVSGLNELTEKIDTMIGQCFEYDISTQGNQGLQAEYAFYAKAGYDLGSVEKQFALEPGQLLIFDNLRCVHGRVGKRHKEELYNYLFGFETAKTETIDQYRSWLIKQAS